MTPRTSKIDLITLEMYWRRLVSIVGELGFDTCIGEIRAWSRHRQRWDLKLGLVELLTQALHERQLPRRVECLR